MTRILSFSGSKKEFRAYLKAIKQLNLIEKEKSKKINQRNNKPS